jgi:Fe-S-cluster-containing hydrogenase component 2
MKRTPRELGYLPLEVVEEKMTLPSKERMAKGPVVIVECVEGIPCDPCVESCRKGALTKDSLSSPPRIDYEECTGCGLCVASCPGLAIFVIDCSQDGDKGLVYIPYEMLPVPQKGDRGDALDRCGEQIGSAEVAKIRKGERGTTVLGLLVDKALAMNVRSVRFPEKSHG